MLDRPAQFVIDTHALWWYLNSSSRLSPAAAAAFMLAATGNATLVVPAIVVAEYHFLSVKVREPVTPSDLLLALAAVRGVEFSALGQEQLEFLDRLPEIPEMHDRLIAADAVIRSAPLVTRDALLRASPQIETIW